MSTSLFGWLPSLENGNGQAINQNNPAATIPKRRLQCKRSSTQSSSKISSLDTFCLFVSFSSTIEHSFTERGRKGAVLHSELANSYTRPMGRQKPFRITKQNCWNALGSPESLFTRGNVTNLSDCLLVEEIRNLIEKGAILESFQSFQNGWADIFKILRTSKSGTRKSVLLFALIRTISTPDHLISQTLNTSRRLSRLYRKNKDHFDVRVRSSTFDHIERFPFPDINFLLKQRHCLR